MGRIIKRIITITQNKRLFCGYFTVASYRQIYVHASRPAAWCEMIQFSNFSDHNLLDISWSSRPRGSTMHACICWIGMGKHDLVWHLGGVSGCVFTWVTHPSQCQGWPSVHVLLECNLVSNPDIVSQLFCSRETKDQGSNKYTKYDRVRGCLPYCFLGPYRALGSNRGGILVLFLIHSYFFEQMNSFWSKWLCTLSLTLPHEVNIFKISKMTSLIEGSPVISLPCVIDVGS